jgi:thymidylate kinase
MKIVTFSGIDGSGKSTQLGRLQERLESEGKRVAYFHAVHFSLPQATRRFFQRSTSRPGRDAARTESSSIGVFLRKMSLLADLWRFRSFLRKLEERGYTHLLSDRYFYDTLVNIAYLDGTALDTPFSRFATRLIPRPERAFLLRLRPEAVLGRERAPEQGLAYLRDKAKLFDEAAGLWSFVIIEANADAESVFRSVSSAV